MTMGRGRRVPTPVEGEWTVTGTGTPLQFIAAEYIGDDLYTYGGGTGSMATQLTRRMAKSESSFTVLSATNPPSLRVMVASCSANGKFYVCGGRRNPSGAQVTDNGIYEYDPVTNNWSVFATMHVGSYGHTFFYYRDTFWYIGGDVVNLYRMDPETKVFSQYGPNNPAGTCYYTTARVIGNKLVIGGGYNPSNLIAVFDFDAMTWSTVPGPGTSFYVQTGASDEYYYIFGGQSGGAAVKTAYRFSPSTGILTPYPALDLLKALACSGAAMKPGRILTLVGGIDQAGAGNSNVYSTILP